MLYIYLHQNYASFQAAANIYNLIIIIISVYIRHINRHIFRLNCTTFLCSLPFICCFNRLSIVGNISQLIPSPMAVAPNYPYATCNTYMIVYYNVIKISNSNWSIAKWFTYCQVRHVKICIFLQSHLNRLTIHYNYN